MSDIDHLILIIIITVSVDTLIHRFHGYARLSWNFITMTLFTCVMVSVIYTAIGIIPTYAILAIFNIYTADASLRKDSSIYEKYIGTIYKKLG